MTFLSKKKFYRNLSLVVLVFSIFPSVAHATCSSEGYTVIFTNGIFTSKTEAESNNDDLESIAPLHVKGEEVRFLLGYNPSHLGGVGDLLQAVTQAFGKPLSQYDLNTILMQIHPEVTTRKILLVGHSQGTFYTNEMYQYLIEHGVPRESIAVYNIATPASHVAGGGGYVTSTNDKLINAVRTSEIEGNLEIYANSFYTVGGVVASALRANITVPKEDGHAENAYGGHKLSVYLDGAAPRIVRDIDGALDRLKVASAGESGEGCFVPPNEDLTHKAKSVVYAVADPVVEGFVAANTNIAKTAKSLAQGMVNGIASAGQAFNNLFGKPQVAPTQVAAASSAFEIETVTKQAPVNQPKPQEKKTPPKNVSPVPTEILPSDPIDIQIEQPTSSPPVDIERPLTPVPLTPGYGGGSSNEQTHESNTVGEDDQVDEEEAGEIPPSEPAVLDIEPPATTTASIVECVASIVSGMCVIPSTHINLQWESASDAAYYGVLEGSVLLATTTELLFATDASLNATSTYAVVSYDSAGNTATSSAVEIMAIAQPLIINEIGWAGDNTDPTHQWIELKNISPYTIDVSKFTIARSAESIVLSGSIPAGIHNFAVVQSSTFQVAGNNSIVAPFAALPTVSAEQLVLQWLHPENHVTVDTTPAASACPTWCAGSPQIMLGESIAGIPGISTVLSMERISGTTDGSQPDSWRSTDSYGPWLGTGGATWGTAGIENSSGLPEAGIYCGGVNNMAIENESYNPGTDTTCIVLSRFIPLQLNAPATNRRVGIFRGDVGSSTSLTGNGHPVFGLAAGISQNIESLNPSEGEQFFFAIWEHPTAEIFSSTSVAFNLYFTASALPSPQAPTPPHGNYVIIPWTYTSQ